MDKGQAMSGFCQFALGGLTLDLTKEQRRLPSHLADAFVQSDVQGREQSS